MSFPNIPNITPTISIDLEQCESMLLASIALEELGLCHIMNAEAEKMQYVLGTLEGQKPPQTPSMDELLQVSNSVASTMRGIYQNKMILGTKMEDVLNIYGWDIVQNIATVTAEYQGQTVTASDKAYYHTKGGALS